MVDELDNSVHVMFHDEVKMWWPSDALKTPWDATHESDGLSREAVATTTTTLALGNGDHVVSTIEKQAQEARALELALEEECQSEVAAMNAAKARRIQSVLVSSVKRVHDDKIEQLAQRLTPLGLTLASVKRMAESVPSQLRPELLAVGISPTDADKFLRMVVPKSRRRQTVSVMDGVAAWLARQGSGEGQAPAPLTQQEKDTMAQVANVVAPVVKDGGPAVADATDQPDTVALVSTFGKRLPRARALRNFTMECEGELVDVEQGALLVLTESSPDKRWWSGYVHGGRNVPGEFLSKVVKLLSIRQSRRGSVAEVSFVKDDGMAEQLRLAADEPEPEPAAKLGDEEHGLDALELLAPELEAEAGDVATEVVLQRLRRSLKDVAALTVAEADAIETRLRMELDDLSLEYTKKQIALRGRQEQRRLQSAAALAKGQAANLRALGIGGAADIALAKNTRVEHARAALGLAARSSTPPPGPAAGGTARRGAAAAGGGAPGRRAPRPNGPLAELSERWWPGGTHSGGTASSPPGSSGARGSASPGSYADVRQHRFSLGEAVEVFSSSLGEWVQAVVAHLSEEAQQLTVRYEGRTKVVDLADAAVSTTLRVRSTPPIIKRMYEQGDRVEIYSESKQAWMAGMVVAVDGRKIM
eukprot:COSAG01_NODE_4211_length_5237_cov_66.257688_4_plen_645_part_01